MMANKFTLHLDKRETFGRKVKRLRKSGIIPANIFGKKTESIAVQLPEKEFQKAFSAAGETSILYATVGDEKTQRPVLVSMAQIHPVTGSFVHVDFHQVDLTQKVIATVPLVLEGESPAVADLGAILVQMMNEIEVEALPAEIPHEIVLDISSLKEFGDFLTVQDLKVDTSKVEIQAEPEEQIVQVQEPKEEEVEETPTEAAEGAEAPKAEGPGGKGETKETPSEQKAE